MNTSFLRVTRWSLIALLSAILCYFFYLGITGIVPMFFRVDATVSSILGVVMVTLLFAVMTLIPGIMVYSLITKKLIGLASCVGMAISLAAFYAAIVLPNKFGLMEFWFSISFIPGPIKVICGLVLSFTLLAFPFWLLFRLIRLTNEWFYPKILKPLEAKI